VRDRLTNAVLAELVYDALGRVAAGTLDGGDFEQWYDESTPIHELLGAAPGSTRQHSSHPLWPSPLGVVDAAGQAYVHQDAGWSTMCVTDSAGAVLERHRHGLFGEAEVFAADGVTAASTLRTQSRWRGMSTLGGTTLFQTPARLYDSATGVFASRDPLLYADSPSPYAFAGHNPVDFADPSGFGKTTLGSAPETRTGISRWLYEDSKGAWRSPSHPGDLFSENAPRDSGSTVKNYAYNTWTSLTNILAAVINTPFEMLYDLDDAMRHSRFSVEWQGPMQFMTPMMKTMGLAMETAGTLTYLLGRLPSAAQLSAVNRSMALSLTTMGGLGGMYVPARRAQSAARVTKIQYVGETPALGDSLWALYQRYATGSDFEAFFRIVKNGTKRDVLADALTNLFLVEAKLGNMGQMWNRRKEAQIIRQVKAYLEIADALGLRGVRYAVSTEVGAELLQLRFARQFAKDVASGKLSVWWVP